MANVARQHAEWLSLLEVNGPFLSMSVLLDAFPQGLDAHDSDHAYLFRTFYEEWLENQNSNSSHPALHKAWVDFVLKETLGFTEGILVSGQTIPETLALHVPRENETLRPSLVLVNPTTSEAPGQARLLIDVLPPSQGIERAMESHRWKASPASRMLELLKATNTRLGLVTNGEQWMLVSAASGESAGYIMWTSELFVEEPITLRAFRSLLGLRRFFGVAESKTIEALLDASLVDANEVTEQLGYQVRKAVEVFIQAVDRIDQDRNRELLSGLTPAFLYEAALTVMMRLVFLFSAEERGLFLLGDELYDQCYAVSTLRAQLRETADHQGEEILSRRSDAWCRLLATFRTVYGGVEHDSLRLPAYGGNLFDPDRFPLLEGRSAGTNWRESRGEPLPINNQVVLHLLEALQILQVRVPGGKPEPRRLSFSALGVEQIGHVYEGLLDHTAVRATSPVLGLIGSKNQEAEVELVELERLNQNGQEVLVDYLKKITGRQASTLKRSLDAALNSELSDQSERERLMQTCNNDAALLERVIPFARLVRSDSMNFPVVICTGNLYVTKGSERRSSGTYYTPPSLTEPIVKHTLDPLVYVGPAEGLPEAEWKLKAAKEILDLKVCDMAMGSGAFLVQVCRYLAEKLVEAWGEAEAKNPGAFIVTPSGDLSEGETTERLLPIDPDERLLIARRFVADKCIYGVDKNDLAVNMAKLSLWLVTLHRDRPFTFLDHALKRGDSLLGVTTLKQIENFSLRPDVTQMTFGTANLFRYVDQAATKRRELEDLPSNNYADIESKNRLYAEAEAATAKVKAIGDHLIAFELRGLRGEAYDDERSRKADEVELLMKLDADAGIHTAHRYSSLARSGREELHQRPTFHWPIEFPEVFVSRGFDAIVGNPPYLGGPKLTGTFGKDCRDFWIRHIAFGQKGTADLAAYFCLRTVCLIAPTGNVGLVVTSSVAEGDTREVGLQQLENAGVVLYSAVQRKSWPGSAKVTFTAIWLHFGKWQGQFLLDDRRVVGITSYLTEKGKLTAVPYKLTRNSEKSFNGAKVYGEGFVVGAAERNALIARDPRNNDVIFPYLVTEDLNSRPDCSASKWAIRFFDWPLNRATAPDDYDGPVAADYPDCLAIVEERVKPERTRRDADGKFVLGPPLPQKWWIYGRTRPALYDRLAGLQRALAIGTSATKYVAFAFVPTSTVFSHSLAIITDDSFRIFGALSSSLHEVWARRYGSYNLSLLRYSPSDVFDTFSLPCNGEELEVIGESYYSHRHKQMLERQEGLTDIYNRFHDRHDVSTNIVKLRELQVKLDQSVATAYGWGDLSLDHGFYLTKQGERFTIREAARREVLDRLLQLNHERYAEEQRLGLHDKKPSKKRASGRRKKPEAQRKSPADQPVKLFT